MKIKSLSNNSGTDYLKFTHICELSDFLSEISIELILNYLLDHYNKREIVDYLKLENIINEKLPDFLKNFEATYVINEALSYCAYDYKFDVDRLFRRINKKFNVESYDLEIFEDKFFKGKTIRDILKIYYSDSNERILSNEKLLELVKIDLEFNN